MRRPPSVPAPSRGTSCGHSRHAQSVTPPATAHARRGTGGRLKRCAIALALAAAGALDGVATAAAQSPFDSLRFRPIGPAALGGRIHDVEGVPGDPLTLYVASASGGLWKTTNKGTTWTPIFEQQKVATFGDVAIFEGDARILYVGTGEQNNRQSSSWGNGVYKSTDGGATWTHLGLEKTRHIGRVAVHPTNPDIAWVAA
ncbi:MAG TPA: hypothetical protein VFV33_15340, partial [Gemmatimonadaceae bacterium]|nr:hypothetical protein [Gemmatimonadaceae bacterium]